jgi:hypothetical protein
MLTRKVSLDIEGMEVGTTPLLIPSVSSRANIPLDSLLQTISEIIEGPLLVSAYDVYHSDNDLDITFPDLIFLDSGGYECNKDQDVSDIGLYNPNPLEWNENLHNEVINGWNTYIPTVYISYDHPSKREPLENQVENAHALFSDLNGSLREIIIKPETFGAVRIHPEDVIDRIDLLHDFNIIGFAEKELGHSVFKKMCNLATIRKAFDEAGLNIPIHLFGSLDPVTTPLYYFAGADLFDGLSWLRFSYERGDALYIESHGPKIYGADENDKKIWIQSVYQNYSYLRRLKMNMDKFHSSQDYTLFEDNASFFEETCDDLQERVGGI